MSDAFAPWIEDLYNRQITAGCQEAPPLYCPVNPVTRGQMAVFLVKAFALPARLTPPHLRDRERVGVDLSQPR